MCGERREWGEGEGALMETKDAGTMASRGGERGRVGRVWRRGGVMRGVVDVE